MDYPAQNLAETQIFITLIALDTTCRISATLMIAKG